VTVPFDIRLTWFRRLPATGPMGKPGLDIDQLEDANPLEVGNGTMTPKHFMAMTRKPLVPLCPNKQRIAALYRDCLARIRRRAGC
jgi:hypothetical protein